MPAHAMRRTCQVLVTITLVAATACGSDSGTTPAPSETLSTTAVPSANPTAPTTPASSVTPTVTPTVTTTVSPPTDGDEATEDVPFPADTEPDTAAASSGAALSPVNVRFARHDGYDRVVLDLVGDGRPGWRAAYGEARQQGSGRPVDVDGEAVLVVEVDGAQLPFEEGAKEYSGPSMLDPDDAGVVDEVVVGSVFEGRQELYVGVDSRQPFRVFRLADPTRVVIDIQHP